LQHRHGVTETSPDPIPGDRVTRALRYYETKPWWPGMASVTDQDDGP
jgi:hypothetical protein